MLEHVLGPPKYPLLQNLKYVFKLACNDEQVNLCRQIVNLSCTSIAWVRLAPTCPAARRYCRDLNIPTIIPGGD